MSEFAITLERTPTLTYRTIVTAPTEEEACEMAGEEAEGSGWGEWVEEREGAIQLRRVEVVADE